MIIKSLNFFINQVSDILWIALFFVLLQWYKFRAAKAHHRDITSPYNPINATGRKRKRSYRLLTEFLFFYNSGCHWYSFLLLFMKGFI